MVGIVTPSERTVSAPPNVVDGGLAAPVGFQVMNPLGTAAWSKYGSGNRDWQVAPTGPIINGNSITAYCVNTANAGSPGNDSNSGDCTHPLLTLSELANRLLYARIEVPITITVTGNAVAGDNAHWTFTTNTAITYAVTGVLPVQIVGVPTVLYTGSATTVTTITAGATTTDNELADTAVPTSFTAAGLMATGVLFSRTNSTPLFWYAAKDLGSQTIRISQPTNPVTVTDGALSTSDTYTASALPTVNQMTFGGVNPPYSILLKNLSLTTSFYEEGEAGTYLINDWFPSGAALNNGNSYINCAVSGGVNMYGTQSAYAVGVWSTGLVKGTGNTTFQMFNTRDFFFENRLTFQGAKLLVQLSSAYLANDMAVNDATSASGVLQLINNANVQVVGTIQGSNNAGLVKAGMNSVLTFAATTPMVAGSSTDTTTPIKSTGTASTNVAGYTSGNTVLNTSGNGIYKTQ
jgi:hypothetical protein